MNNAFNLAKKSLHIFSSVVWALFLRDLKDKIFDTGLLVLFSPLLIQLGIQLFIYYVLKRQTIMGMNKVLFIITGYLPFLLFEKIMLESSMIFSMIKDSLSIKQIRVFDAIIATAFTWFIITITILFVSLFFVYFILDTPFIIYDLGAIICSFVICFFMALGFGMCFTVVGAYMKSPVLVVFIFSKSIYFASGIFFPISAVPYGIRQYLLLNPLLHIVELDRYAFIATNLRDGANFEYPLFWTLVSLFIGFAVYLNFKDVFLKKAFE